MAIAIDQVFRFDAFGDPAGLGPAFDELVTLSGDLDLRPHGAAARDRVIAYAREVVEVIREFDETSDGVDPMLPWVLGWMADRHVQAVKAARAEEAA